jgi:hypothetical protein
MSRDLHPKIIEQAREDGWSQDADVDLGRFTELHQAHMVLMGPADRMRILNRVTDAIGADDGTSIKSKADLLELRRSLSRTHEALLRSGR